MRIVIAPDSYKESISAVEAAEALAAGARQASPAAEIDLCPMADGGEGTVEAMVPPPAGSSARRTPSARWANPCGRGWGSSATGPVR